MKTSTFLAVFTFCTLTASFGILIIGALVSQNQVYVDLFALFLAVGFLAFWGWVAVSNSEKKYMK
jgi:4-hydroxybenzoate polyprenyltransferase